MLGMTYPSYSRKYVENVCTGGIFADDLTMCRIHPVPHRYWAEEARFKSWQWIEADVRRNEADPRPESWKLGDAVTVGDIIPAGDKGWGERRTFLEGSPHLFDEWGAVQRANAERKVSLAIVRPAEIIGVRFERKAAGDEAEWKEKEGEILAQPDMFRTVKPLDFVPLRFKVEFRCKDEPAGTSHSMSVLQWGLHELYRKYKSEPDAVIEEKVLGKMRRELDATQRDIFLFLGTFRERLTQWGLMDTASPPRQAQMPLF